jgi:hypothetical protein
MMRSLSFGVAASLAFAGTLLCTAGGCRRSDPQGPAETAARGRELLAQASATLKAAPTLTVDTVERHERVRRNGERKSTSLSRQVRLRRPDRLSFHAKGDGVQDLRAVYDGRTFTLVGNGQKVYAQIDAPGTVDGLLDRLAERFDVPMPMADFLYSDPSQSFQAGEFTGGWVKRAQIDGATCHELHYTGKSVEFTLWVDDTDKALPCKVSIVYAARKGKPTSDVTFRNWQLGSAIPEGEFAANVPSGFERIPIIERIPKDDLKKDAAKAMAAAAK